MKQSLSLKTTQQLTLTPQLKQSLRLLQLSATDLQKEIQAELDLNPLLENAEESEFQDTHSDIKSDDNSNEVSPATEQTASETWTEAKSDDDIGDTQPESDWPQSHTQSGPNSINNEGIDWQQTHESIETLAQHLYWQVRMAPLSERDLYIAKSLLHSLDEDGYLTLDLDSVCDLMDPELDINRDEIHAVLSLIKTLEPLGVGARNLSERLCLLLDAQACDPQVRKLAKLIVAENLSLLAARNYQGIRKALKKVANYSTAQVTEAAKLIGSLNPRISSQFGEHLQNQITADVMVQKKSGRWVAKLNPEHEIRLAINTQYTDMLSSASDEKSAEFLQNHLNQAKTFIKNVHSRYATLLAVAQAVVDSQQEFFEHGGERMTPLVLQDIASQLELHESTISRATAGKYLLCDRGLFELKYFFSSAVPQQDGNTTSSIAIRSLIKKLVSSESKVKPLSDSRLAKELESQGHSVARRTVAKYRESLQIAPSSQRKQLGNN